MTTENTAGEPITPDNKTQQNVFEDVSKLTNKDIKYRSKYKETVAEKEEITRKLEKAESEKAELVKKAESVTRAAQDRIVQAELKALVVSEGIKDIDVAKLIDLSAIKMDEKGDIIGLKEAVADFKTRKPDFFGSQKMTSSSSNAGNVTQNVSAKVDARNLTKEEYEAAKSKLLRDG